MTTPVQSGPSRVSVNIRMQKDKYGHGAELFIGGADAGEFEANVQQLLGDNVLTQLVTMGVAEVLHEYERVTGDGQDPIAQAEQNLTNGGMVPAPGQQPVSAGPPAPGSSAPAAPGAPGGGAGSAPAGGGKLGAHPTWGGSVWLNPAKPNGKGGMFSASVGWRGATPDAKLYVNLPAGYDITTVTLDYAVQLLNAEQAKKSAG